ncbi:MAG: phosphate ABC transporter permease subunit PstC [Bacilli bacterium]|jgi:phosphate transport system permease protein|nr:phosphate ABC transporter permease subunit PstC [Bacilli bacterium]
MKKYLNKQLFFETLYKLSIIFASLLLLLIIIFIFFEGVPALKEYGVFKMLFNMSWQPTAHEPSFGLSKMILATIISTLLSLLIAIPIGLLSSVCLVRLVSRKIKNIIMFIVEILAGIPSVIVGFFVLKTIVAFLYQHFYMNIGVSGNSMLAAVFVLALMALPTIITITVKALEAVNPMYTEASLGLGANKIQTIYKVELKAAKSGIMAAIVLGAGRVIGETMAVMLVSGNAINISSNLLLPTRTLTANIATEMSYASGLHQSALYASGIVLFIMIMLINITLLIILNKGGGDNA